MVGTDVAAERSKRIGATTPNKHGGCVADMDVGALSIRRVRKRRRNPEQISGA